MRPKWIGCHRKVALRVKIFQLHARLAFPFTFPRSHICKVRFCASAMRAYLSRSKRYKASPGLSRTETALQSVKIVAVTAWGEELFREKIKAARFDLHLTKPSLFGELIEITQQA
jgi:hypothetical protein